MLQLIAPGTYDAAVTAQRSRLAIAACVAVGICAVLAVLAFAHRASYGQWPPAPPDRIGWCGRRYTAPQDQSPRGPAFPVRPIGRHPPIVGAQFYAPRDRLSDEACALLIYRKTRTGWYTYGLSGSP